MYHRQSDEEYIRALETYIDSLEAENTRLKKESADYLDKWVSAQDLAAHRNMLLLIRT